jgi:hypothetical protein
LDSFPSRPGSFGCVSGDTRFAWGLGIGACLFERAFQTTQTFLFFVLPVEDMAALYGAFFCQKQLGCTLCRKMALSAYDATV